MKNMILISLLISFLFLAGCNVESKETINQNFKEISALEAHDLMQNKTIQVLDVRTDEEYDLGHIENSINIDFYNPNFKNMINHLDKDTPYIVYCRSGKRSIDAVKIMNNLGFDQIYNLNGGINSWQENNLPLLK